MKKPVWVVNCAAYIKVDACETDEKTATLLNGTAPGYLASECASLGIKLLHISTDYVFDGQKEGPYKEDDPVNPINAYGRSKLKGELAIISNMKKLHNRAHTVVVRREWAKFLLIPY